MTLSETTTVVLGTFDVADLQSNESDRDSNRVVVFHFSRKGWSGEVGSLNALNEWAGNSNLLGRIHIRSVNYRTNMLMLTWF